MQPDPTYKRIFAHDFMVEQLMRWFVADLRRARTRRRVVPTGARNCGI